MQLYKIAEEFAVTLAKAVNEETGEIDPQLADALNALEVQFSDKVSAIAAYSKGIDAEAEAYEKESARLKKHADSLRKRESWLKGYLKCEMDRLGVAASGSGMHVAKIQKNSQVSMRVKENVPLDLERMRAALPLIQRKTPTSFEMMVGPWSVSIELVSKALLKDESAPERQFVEFETGTHLRIK